MKNDQKYYKFSDYLKERFGCRVHKVSIDAGFSCPNKDGKLSTDGCIYCDNKAFSFPVRNSTSLHKIGTISNGARIETQIENGIAFGRQRYGAEKFIVYFQAYSNTYAPLDILKQRYDVVRKFEDIVGISIGTRPDCVNEEILDLIESYAGDYEVWIEYGLQSIHDKTLKLINRHHTYEDFLKAVELTRAPRWVRGSAPKQRSSNIKICAHIIIGLPNETKEEMLETAKALAKLKIDGVKIHPLHVVKGTKLEELFKKGKYKPLELDEYVDIVTEFLGYLPSDTVIQRLTADCPKEFLVAPEWLLEKSNVLRRIEETLKERNTYQGKTL